MMVHLLEEDPGGQDMMLVAKEFPAIVQVVALVLGASLLSIINGFTSSTELDQ